MSLGENSRPHFGQYQTGLFTSCLRVVPQPVQYGTPFLKLYSCEIVVIAGEIGYTGPDGDGPGIGAGGRLGSVLIGPGPYP